MINTSSLLRYAATFASLVMMVMMSCTDPSSEPTPSILQVSFSGDTLRSLRGTVDPTCRVTADWTICPDNDFQRYILYRAGWPGMYYNPSSAEVVGVFGVKAREPDSPRVGVGVHRARVVVQDADSPVGEIAVDDDGTRRRDAAEGHQPECSLQIPAHAALVSSRFGFRN